MLPRQLQAGRSSLPQRRLESDADVVVATPAAGGPFYFAAAKIRIGCGPRSRYDRSRRNHSLLSQRKLVSDADVVVATPAAGWPFFFAAMKNRIGRGTRCCHGHCRQAILLCCDENWKRTRKTVETTNSAGETLHRFSSLGLKSRITARWMAFQSKTLH